MTLDAKALVSGWDFSLIRFCTISMILLFVSCIMLNTEEMSAPVDCVEYPIDSGIITFELTLDDLNQEVTIEVYKGKIDAGELIDRFIANEETVSKYYPTGEYSALAKYQYKYNNTLITLNTVDEERLESESTEYSDRTCYEMGEIDLNLRLDTGVR